MNTTQLFNSFVYRFNPKCIAVNESCADTQNIDCCLLSKYTDPTNLWYMLTDAIFNANPGCIIFIDSLSRISPGETVPYPVSVSLIATSMAVYADITTIDTGESSTIVIKVYNRGIRLNKDILKYVDFSSFNNRVASNLFCRSVNLMDYTSVGWLRKSLETTGVPSADKVDIVFTLAGADSPTDNEELKIALRSIDTHAKDVGDIYIVTDNPPKWVQNVNIVHVPDTYTNNKDANLITKILHACDIDDLSERFIYWSDDQVLTSDVSLKYILPTYNTRGIDSFSRPDAKKWSIRMKHTLDLVQQHGGDVSHNWDSHVPQPIDKTRFRDIMNTVDFTTLPGVCINTAYFGLKCEPKQWSQTDVKLTYENSDKCDYVFNKLFVGYNDSGYNAGLKEALLKEFPSPSKYEKNDVK